MTTGSPFSGGQPGDNPNTPPSAPTGALKTLFDMLNDKATTRMMVGPEGSQVLMSFAPTGVLTIVNGTTTIDLPFKRV